MKKNFGLLGFQIQNSLSPQIHKKFFELKNVKANYSIFNIPKEKFEDFFKEIDKLDGFNITTPYKDKVFAKFEKKSQVAESLKTTNTVVKEKNHFICHNTDYYGFLESLKHFEIKLKKNILLLGLGGAGKVVAKRSINSGCFLTIAVRKNSISKAENSLRSIISKKKINHFEIVAIEKIPNRIYNIIVNATPIGMSHLDKNPIKEKFLVGCSAAIDLIYYPTETKFLKAAKKLKIKTVSGLFMLISQAKKANELFLKTKIKKDYVFKIYKQIKNILNIT